MAEPPPVTRSTPDTSELPDVLKFMELLWAIVHALERTSKRMTHEMGVTGPQRLVLRIVGLFPGLSAGDLAAILRVHPSTLTGVLQRLVSQRLVERVGDPRDRRRAVLRLTPGGAQTNRRRHGTVESGVGQALAGTSADDRLATRRVLRRLADCLDRAASSAGRTGESAKPTRRGQRRPAG